MKTDISSDLVHEHALILRMLTILENKARLLGRGQFTDYRFFLDAVDFIRNYADRFHHAKEEDVLFEALIENGMPKQNSPVAAMLMEHDQGRAYVRGMERAAVRALAGEKEAEQEIVENAVGYLELLREHISKENDILYPLAERVIPEEKRERIVAAYRKAEAERDGIEARYTAIVQRYENG